MTVLKVIEIMANSTVSWEDAANNAVEKASETIKNIRSVYVKEQSAEVSAGKIIEYRVTLKLTFEVL